MFNYFQQRGLAGLLPEDENHLLDRFPGFREPRARMGFHDTLKAIQEEQWDARLEIEQSYDDPNFVDGQTPISALPTEMRMSAKSVDGSTPGTSILFNLIDHHLRVENDARRDRGINRFFSGMIASMRLHGRHLVLNAHRTAKIRAALAPNRVDSQQELAGFDSWMMPVSQKSQTPLAGLAAREGTLAQALEASKTSVDERTPVWPWAVPLVARADRDGGRGLTFAVFEAIDHGHGRSIPAEVRNWGLTNGRNETVAYCLAVQGITPRTWAEDTAFPWLLSNQGSVEPRQTDSEYLKTPAHVKALQGGLPDDLVEMINDTMPQAWGLRGINGMTLAEALVIGNPEQAFVSLGPEALALTSSTFFLADRRSDPMAEVPTKYQTVGFVLERAREFEALKDSQLICDPASQGKPNASNDTRLSHAV